MIKPKHYHSFHISWSPSCRVPPFSHCSSTDWCRDSMTGRQHASLYISIPWSGAQTKQITFFLTSPFPPQTISFTTNELIMDPSTRWQSCPQMFEFQFSPKLRSLFHLDEWNSVMGCLKIKQMRKKWSILKFSLPFLHCLKDPVQTTIQKVNLYTHMPYTTHWFFDLSLNASPASLEPFNSPEEKKKNFLKTSSLGGIQRKLISFQY